MRIVQLIDSLETGGAERMAVNYANALRDKIGFSAVVVTRKEGNLSNDLGDGVGYSFLAKKSTIDLGAILRLRKYCKANSVNVIHAHSTSWFLAVCVKLTMPSVKIIWHDHYGSSEFVDERKFAALKFGSYFFGGILSVNEKLADWAKRKLNCANVTYLANFFQIVPDAKKTTELFGQKGKRILALANLRPQKNHFLILDSLRFLPKDEWTFHLVGKDFDDDYSARLRQEIESDHLESRVFIYGSKDDVQHIISESEICILTSNSEGLPVALLEYGAQSKAVLVTAVGEIPSIVNDGVNGRIVAPGNAKAFAAALEALKSDAGLRDRIGKNLYGTIVEGFSEQAVIFHYLNWLKRL
ncbi:MAG: glycosyltransferase [Flavobacterium sp.]|nr:MAG: glycosyltransferase [Flavobacterium sp.]